MKKIALVAVTAVASMALVAPAAVAVEPGMVPAYTKKQNKVWRAVKQLSPLGAKIMGKKDTVNHAKTACKMLRNGMDLYDLAEIYVAIAYDNDLTGDAEELWYEWTASTDIAAVNIMCKDQKWKADAL